MVDLENQQVLISGCSSGTVRALAEVVANAVVDAATAARPPAMVRVGNGSRLLPAIGALPVSFRDQFFGRRFGLDRLSVGYNVRRRERGSRSQT